MYRNGINFKHRIGRKIAISLWGIFICHLSFKVWQFCSS